METIQQEKLPTKIYQERVSAMQGALDRVMFLIQESDNKVEASRKFLEEVKGKDYRLEQAAAKLVEYFELQEELGKREGEITRLVPDAVKKLLSRSGDEKYLVTA